MKLMQVVARIAIMVAIIVGAVALPASALAQEQPVEPNLYTSQLSGFDVAASGPEFEITGADLLHFRNGEGERVVVESADSYVEISFFDDTDTPQQSVDAYIAGLESEVDAVTILDTGVRGEATYFVAEIEVNSNAILYYLQVTPDVTGNVDVLERINSSPRALDDSLVAAQDEITIDGDGFLDDVDGEWLSTVFETGGPVSQADTATPVVDDADPTKHRTLQSIPVGIDEDSAYAFYDELFESETVEQTYILGPYSFSAIAIASTGLGADEAMDEYVSSYQDTFDTIEELGLESDEGYAWTLFSAVRDGEESWVLVVVDAERVPGHEVLELHEVSTPNIAQVITALQQDLTIDGEPSMLHVDAAEMQALIDGAGDDSDSTPVVTEEEDPSGDPREDAKLPIGEEETATADVTEDATEESTAEATGVATTGTEGEWPGVLTETSWTGGVLKHEVSWDPETFSVDFEDSEPIVSDEAGQRDSIALISARGGPPAFLYVDVITVDGYTPQDYLDYWTSDEYLSGRDDSQPELLRSRSRTGSAGVVYREYTSDGSEFVLVREATQLDENTMLLVLFVSLPEQGGAGYTLAQESITVDGEPVLRMFSENQINRAFED